MIEHAIEELTPIVGTRPAFRALGAAPATIYRRRNPPAPRPPRPKLPPARALSGEEREAVLEELHSERFIDCSPAQTWATLLDEGRYLASERTMYRILAAAGETAERRDQLVHPPYARPELLAERPNEPPYAIQATTTSGETFGSSVQNSVIGEIKTSSGPGITYDPATMWSSDVVSDGWADLQLTFPFPVGLTGITVHSQHSGLYHAATRLRLSIVGGAGEPTVTEQNLAGPDATIGFARRTSQTWRLEFQTTDTQMVVIRGLEFFDGSDEVFPPLVPYRGP